MTPPSEWTTERLQGFLAYWKEALGLQNWRVVAKLARRDDMPEGQQGANHYVQVTRESTICVLDPIDYPTDTSHPQDVEETLVHELIHLHFAPFMADSGPNDENQAQWMLYVAMEQAIEATAVALVGERRKATLTSVVGPVDPVDAPTILDDVYAADR